MEAVKMKNCSRGDAARRLDCPAFRRALETGQTNRRNINLAGRALNGYFQNLATPQSWSVAPISEMPAHCEGHPNGNRRRSMTLFNKVFAKSDSEDLDNLQANLELITVYRPDRTGFGTGRRPDPYN